MGDDRRRRRLFGVEKPPARDGVVFSAIVFALKAGLGFGGAIGGWLLAAYGYMPNVTQTERALQGIKLTTSVFPAITPRWVFEDSSGAPVSRDTLLARLRDHMQTVVGRYRGRVKGWDVVNEAVDEDGTLRNTPWLTIIGEDHIERAFEYAHEADPAAELYYNDYSVENAPKRNGVIALIRKLRATGVPVAAVGLQGHTS